MKIDPAFVIVCISMSSTGTGMFIQNEKGIALMFGIITLGLIFVMENLCVRRAPVYIRWNRGLKISARPE